jgi:hypothetical protein
VTVRPVQPNQPIEFHAREWNELAAAANRVNNRPEPSGRDRFGSYRIQVRNLTANNLSPGQVLAVEGPIIPPDTNEPEFLHKLALEGIEPRDPEDRGKFVIALEPMKQYDIVPCGVAGIFPVRLQLYDAKHRCADIADGSHTLISVPRGAAEILWLQSMTTEQETWAIVRIGQDNRTPRWEWFGSQPDVPFETNLLIDQWWRIRPGESVWWHEDWLHPSGGADSLTCRTTGYYRFEYLVDICTTVKIDTVKKIYIKPETTDGSTIRTPRLDGDWYTKFTIFGNSADFNQLPKEWTFTGSGILYAEADDTFQLRIQADDPGPGAFDVWELQSAFVLLGERIDYRGIQAFEPMSEGGPPLP